MRTHLYSLLLLLLLTFFSVPAFAQQSSDDIIDVAEQPASFPGLLSGFIGSSIHYPDFALRNCIGGQVMVKFVIGTDGSPSSQAVSKSVHSTLDSEATRVMISMPRWRPARYHGRLVRSIFKQPLTFNPDQKGPVRLDSLRGEFNGDRMAEYSGFPDIRNYLLSRPTLYVSGLREPLEAFVLVKITAKGRLTAPLLLGRRDNPYKEAIMQAWSAHAKSAGILRGWTPAQSDDEAVDCLLVLPYDVKPAR